MAYDLDVQERPAIEFRVPPRNFRTPVHIDMDGKYNSDQSPEPQKACDFRRNFSKQENTIVNAIPSQGMTRTAIALATGIKVQSVCGRANALLKRGVLKLKPGGAEPYEQQRTSSGRWAEVLIVNSLSLEVT